MPHFSQVKYFGHSYFITAVRSYCGEQLNILCYIVYVHTFICMFINVLHILTFINFLVTGPYVVAWNVVELIDLKHGSSASAS